MSNNTIKFIVKAKEVFSYHFHSPRFASDYIRESGVVTLFANFKGKAVEVTMETGVSYVANDYNYPNPHYEATSIRIDGEQTTLDQIDDQDLVQAINDLGEDSVAIEELNYNSDPEDYLYSLRDLSEDKFGEVYEKISFAQMKEKMKAGTCEIIDTVVV